MLKTNGFVGVGTTTDSASVRIEASKPNYEVGSASKLSLKKPENVWKLAIDDDDETIDPDNLLDDEDLKKPDPTSLRVCGTTGKRKACKDCSCGLADELAGEAKVDEKKTVVDGPKSSCGSVSRYNYDTE